MVSNSISPRPFLVSVVCTNLGSLVHCRGGSYPVQALWDAVRTHRSTPVIAVATRTLRRRKASWHLPWPRGLSAWPGWLVQAPACPGVQLSHAALGMPPHPAPPTDTTEDWGSKLSLWDLFLAWIKLVSTSLISSPCLKCPTPSRTRSTWSGQAAISEALEPKKSLPYALHHQVVPGEV